jgi:hypothetical protein
MLWVSGGEKMADVLSASRTTGQAQVPVSRVTGQVPHKVRCSSAPGTYTPYSLFSDVAPPIRQDLWREFSSWQIPLFWTETAGRIGGSFVD